MRKLSILVALILCVTIGGVYAAWTYPGEDVADGHNEFMVQMDDVHISGASGYYTIESNLELKIIQTASNDYHAALDYISKDGNPIYIRVTFTPDANLASDDIKNFGLQSELYTSTTTTMEYEGRPIFTLFNPSDSNFVANVGLAGSTGSRYTWEKDGSAFVLNFNEAAIKEMIKLNAANGGFYLDTKTKYENFKSCLNGNIELRITDGTINNNNQAG